MKISEYVKEKRNATKLAQPELAEKLAYIFTISPENQNGNHLLSGQQSVFNHTIVMLLDDGFNFAFHPDLNGIVLTDKIVFQ